MSLSVESKIQMARRFFPGLLPIIGEEKYKLVVIRYQELYKKHRFPEHPVLQWHLIEGILPGLALYQILREYGETQENALAKVDKTFEVLFSDNFSKMKMLGRLRFIFLFLRIYIKPAMHQYPPEGWKIEWLQNDENAIRFNMKSCFYFDTFLKFGVPELTAAFCRVDDLTYDNMSSYIRWQRTQTIAKGESYCDFCFLNVKEQLKG